MITQAHKKKLSIRNTSEIGLIQEVSSIKSKKNLEKFIGDVFESLSPIPWFDLACNPKTVGILKTLKSREPEIL